MRKPLTRYLILCVIIMLAFAFFVTSANAEETTNIVCTNSILADFASNLIKENVSVDYIMPSGVCPAYYDAKPSDADKIVSADIIISFGSPMMEPWLGDLLTYNTDCSIIECKNMGEWNIPSGAKIYIQYIATELSDLLPDLNSSITQNAQEYLNQIDDKSQQLKDMVEANNSLGKEVICMGWQEDFLNWLGLNVTYSYGPPQGLSVQDELDTIAAAENAYAVIDNLQSGTDFGARVASESGASHVIFTNFPGAIPGTDNYFDMITYNTEQLIKGISAYEYRQGGLSDLQGQISGLELQRNASLIVAGMFVILTLVFYVMYRRK